MSEYQITSAFSEKVGFAIVKFESVYKFWMKVLCQLCGFVILSCLSFFSISSSRSFRLGWSPNYPFFSFWNCMSNSLSTISLLFPHCQKLISVGLFLDFLIMFHWFHTLITVALYYRSLTSGSPPNLFFFQNCFSYFRESS